MSLRGYSILDEQQLNTNAPEMCKRWCVTPAGDH